jgi:hypothetical protein
MKRVLQPVDPAPFGSKQADCVPVPHTHAVAATVWIRVAIAAQLLMLIYFTVDNASWLDSVLSDHAGVYPPHALGHVDRDRLCVRVVASTDQAVVDTLPAWAHTRLHDNFASYHDHGYAERLKVLALIGECRPPARGLATALSAGDSNGDNRLLQDLGADIRRIYSSGSDAELMIIKAAHRSSFTVIPMTGNIREEFVRVTAGEDTLEGNLSIPANAGGIVLFAHRSGRSRLSPRNRFVAHVLARARLTTLLFDLLTRHHSAVPRTQQA